MATIVPAQGNIFGKLLPARYIFAILGSIGLAIIYGFKDYYTFIFGDVVDSSLNDGSYVVKPRMLMLYYMLGNFISQIPAAYVAHKFSAKWVIFFAVTLNIMCTLLTPMAVHWEYKLLILIQILQGIGLGATFPAMHSMIASWSPANQRSVISTIIYVSMFYGIHISIFCTYKLKNTFGWHGAFYIVVGLSSIWLLLWIILIQDTPNKQRFISKTERIMINSSHGTEEMELYSCSRLPWRNILTSLPFWVIFVSHSLHNWGFYIFFSSTSYKLYRLQITFEKRFFETVIFSIILAIILDILRAKQKITTTTARKIATSIATIIPCICCLIFYLIDHDTIIGDIISTIGVISMGGFFSGFLSNHIDIAPNYAGILGALTSTAAFIPLIISLVVPMESIMENAEHMEIFVFIAFFSAEFFIFVILGSGEEQSWNKSTHLYDIENAAIQLEALYLKLKNTHKLGNINS